MPHRCLALVAALLAAGLTANVQASAVTAQSAYDAKDWKTCAVLNSAAADKTHPPSDAAYNAACCLALSGDTDAAFARLLKTPSDTLPGVAHIRADADLASLHDDPRWQPLLGKLANEQAEREKRYDQRLRKELSIRIDKDQAIREQAIKDQDNKDLEAKMAQIDADNLVWLRSVIDHQGWPTYTVAGRDGALAFWTLVQHADADPDFQEHALALMRDAVKKGQASGSLLAYLTDRVRIGHDKPQVYGTQFGPVVDGKLEPLPMEDPAHVDARRAAVGLGTMAEYRDQMAATYLNKDS